MVLPQLIILPLAETAVSRPCRISLAFLVYPPTPPVLCLQALFTLTLLRCQLTHTDKKEESAVEPVIE